MLDVRTNPQLRHVAGGLALLTMFILTLPPFAVAAIREQSDELQAQKLQLQLENAALQTEATEQKQRQQLELLKLEREIAALEQQPPTWLSPVLTVGATLLSVFGGLIAGFFGAKIAARSALNVAQRNREGELDQAVHEQRLEIYPRLVTATAPLAIYFPDYTGTLDPQHCAQMGRDMSKWYFGGGGLLLSDEARDAYFVIVRALTRASHATELRTPKFPDDAPSLSATRLALFRNNLPIDTAAPPIEAWQFGSQVGDSAPLGEKFRDYVFLQHLSSSLRTELASDIRGRRRPGVSPQ